MANRKSEAASAQSLMNEALEPLPEQKPTKIDFAAAITFDGSSYLATMDLSDRSIGGISVGSFTASEPTAELALKRLRLDIQRRINQLRDTADASAAALKPVATEPIRLETYGLFA